MRFSSAFLALAAAVIPLVSAAPAVTTRAHAKRAAADILVFSECYPLLWVLYSVGRGAALLTLHFFRHLEFADVLEQLESAFYDQALKKFSEADLNAAGFTTASVPAEQFKTIQDDERTHSVVLQVRS